jgi:hypothetical protein
MARMTGGKGLACKRAAADIGLAAWLEVGLTMRLIAQQKMSQNRDLIVPR